MGKKVSGENGGHGRTFGKKGKGNKRRNEMYRTEKKKGE